MRSMIMKDLYNMEHNCGSIVFMLVVIAVALIPTSGAIGYVFTAALLGSMMVVTTFAFDSASKWNQYAAVMPVSRHQIVASKYMILIIFSMVGSAVGGTTGMIGGILTGRMAWGLEPLVEMSMLAVLATVMAVVLGSTTIPLLYKYGAEKGRILIVVAFMIPSGIIFLLWQTLSALGIEMTQQLQVLFMCLAPVGALMWGVSMYRISCRIFDRQELV